METPPKKSPAKRILVVDDDPDLTASLVALLEDNGYRAMQARSAEEGLRRIADFNPDLVCLDVMMPGQSGIALYRRIKLDPRLRHLPAIFISAFSMAKDFTGEAFRKLIPDPGVPEPEAYVEKPLVPQDLLLIIRRALGQGTKGPP